jgi:hypothetical protein
MSLKGDECMDAMKECDEKQLYACIYSFFIGLDCKGGSVHSGYARRSKGTTYEDERVHAVCSAEHTDGVYAKVDTCCQRWVKVRNS